MAGVRKERKFGARHQEKTRSPKERMEDPRLVLRGRIVSIDILAARPAFGLEIETGRIVRCINYIKTAVPNYKRGDEVSVSGQWSKANGAYFYVYGMKVG